MVISLCKEIVLYGKLKENWGLGHVKCTVDKCKCKKYNHIKISGCYVHEAKVKKEIHLRHGFQQGLACVNHVKSFCDFFRMNRMDVNRKPHLLHVCESYWEMLPPKIQHYKKT